tara:strand:- start:1454 stop:1801 length:348 start_codon:yes stop_codon:yes gene_type:complete
MVMNKKLVILCALFLGFCAPAHTEEFNDKPVWCGNDQEVFGTLSGREERKMFEAIQLTAVRDPDEPNGIRETPAFLPVAIYLNFDTKTYSVVEYHPGYNQYCILSLGTDLKIINE